jgi:3-oxoacyl-[acyl-carrier-protein] synthase-3
VLGLYYALSVADQFVKSGMYRTILVIGAEIQSSLLDLSDKGRGMAVIFGDGAGAVVLQAPKTRSTASCLRTCTPTVGTPRN